MVNTIVRIGSSPLIQQLFTSTFEYSTVAGEEPSVGDVVILKSDGKVKKSDASLSEAALGVVLSKNTTEKICAVILHGIVEVVASAAISRGNLIGSSLAGKVEKVPDVPATFDNADINKLKGVLGKALTSAAADGDKIIVALEVV